VLRGGTSGPNYDASCIARCEIEHARAGLKPNIMVDCSHANSNKDYRRQPLVARDVAAQIKAGNRSLIGLMIESHLEAGNQPISSNPAEMCYGMSVTDACIDWDTTRSLLLELSAELGSALRLRSEAQAVANVG